MRIKILKALTIMATIIMLLSACAIDSDSWIPYIVCGISSAWLVFMTIANMPKGSDGHGPRKNI